MADAVIFAGPTLSPADVEKKSGLRSADGIFQLPHGTAEFRGPVSEGDVARLAAEGPAIIGIIDGYYETVPAVWHKEILLAMSRGVHVLGASSMGALRAAELAPFGMEGIGEIYQDFASGVLEDDDEVAVVHAPAEMQYAPLSDAMVNIRRSFAAAEADGVLDSGEAALLNRIAKSLFYKQRTYPSIINIAHRQGMDAGKLAALKNFIAENRIDQKRLDALALAETIFARLNRQVHKKEVLYNLVETHLWKHARSYDASKEHNAV